MAASSTPLVHNLQITGATVQPDGKVRIDFILLRAGVYYHLPWATTAVPPGQTNGFPMTPGPNTTPSPIMAGQPNMPFVFEWDAPADGYTNIDIDNWTLCVGYIDLFCCDEQPEDDDDPVPPPPGSPPNVPNDPGDPQVPDTPDDPADTEDPVVDPGDPEVPIPDNPFDDIDPNNPNESNPIPDNPFPDGLPDGYPSFFAGPDGGIYNGDGVLVVAPGELSAEQFQYLIETEVVSNEWANWPNPPQPTTTQGFDPVGPTTFGPAINPTHRTTATSESFEQPFASPDYSSATMTTSIFGLPDQNDEVRLHAFMASNTFPQDGRVPVITAVENLTDGQVGPYHMYVEGVDAAGSRFVIQDLTPINASSPPQPIGPSGMAGGPSICVQWQQFLTGPVTVYVVLTTPSGQPIIAVGIPGTVTNPTGGLPTPPQNPAAAELNQRIRELAGGGPSTAWDVDIKPAYEGSVNAVGDEDTFNFTAVDNRMAVVVKISADAEQTGFVPVMEIYDVDDPVTPLVTHQERFKVAGTEVEKQGHAIGWIDSVDPFLRVLEKDKKYFIVIRHEYPFYSLRWAFKIFHVQAVPATSGTFTIDVDGNLDGSLTSAYGRQSLKILNDRTNEHIFVKTDFKGDSSDIQVDAKPYATRLAVESGDLLEISRPGPAARYLRFSDLLSYQDAP